MSFSGRGTGKTAARIKKKGMSMILLVHYKQSFLSVLVALALLLYLVKLLKNWQKILEGLWLDEINKESSQKQAEDFKLSSEERGKND